MKILWLSHLLPFPPTGHGSLQRTHHLLREASRSHEIHLLALVPPSGPTGRHETDHACRALATFLASVEAFPLPPNPYGLRRIASAAGACVRPSSFWEDWYWSPAMHRRVRQLVQTSQFDAAHVETVFLGRYLDAVADLPIVLSHHNVESHLLSIRAAAQRSPWARAFFEREARKVRRLERTLAPRVAHNIVVSDLDAERLSEVVAGARMTSVANGVDVDFFAAQGGREPDPGTMIFAGGMNWFPNRDGIEFFVADIWPALVRDDPSRRMTVIGRTPPPALLAAAARDPRTQVLRFVDDIQPHMEAASIYVCPVRFGGGTRLKILDALAMARPLVSTDLGVEGLSLVEGEHYLRGNTPEQFVSQIRRLEGDAKLRLRMAVAGRAFVARQYSWRHIGERLELAYRDAMYAHGNRISAVREVTAS